MNELELYEKRLKEQTANLTALDSDIDAHLAKTFSSVSGLKVLAHWKNITIERQTQLSVSNRQTGETAPVPEAVTYARLGKENFIKDIIMRIERAKKH